MIVRKTRGVPSGQKAVPEEGHHFSPHLFQIEFLPVYEPDAREVADDRVYAHNVREHMAKWLHVGTVDESVGMTNSGKGFRRTDLG